MATKNLAIAAVIAVCIALYFASATASPIKESVTENDTKEQRNQMTQSSITGANQAHNVDFRAKRQSRREDSKKSNCITEMNQNCTPSARLVGTRKQSEWTNIITDDTAQKRYNSSWMCNEEDAFVDCGMRFIYNDQKLYVPICGVYEIYSQVFFQSDVSEAAIVHHKVVISRNCGHSQDNTAEFKSYAGLVPVSPSKVTTTNLATVKMCAGGSVSVVIPEEDNVCCPYGRKPSTYFSARLVSEVDCDSIE